MWRPINEGLCSLHQLQDGTYSIDDLADFHELLNLRVALTPEPPKPKQSTPYG